MGAYTTRVGVPAGIKETQRWWKVLFLTIVVFVLTAFGFVLLASRGTFAAHRRESEAGGSAFTVDAHGHRMTGRVYVTGAPVSTMPIVVVLHGDAPFVNPSYQYAFASELADELPGTHVAALLRPGYADPYGDKSEGDRGFALGENYTPEVVNNIAAAIQSLKSRWRATAVVLVGHSGGAAIAANVVALNRGLVQHVFLVGCPCDVPAFRRHMARLQWNPMWLLPTHGLSPLETLNKMEKGIGVTAISGTKDPITLPQYARAYVTKAKAVGLDDYSFRRGTRDPERSFGHSGRRESCTRPDLFATRLTSLSGLSFG